MRILQFCGSTFELLIMRHIIHRPILLVTECAIVLAIWIAGPMACADETGAQSGFEEHRVEFHNHDVKLAGSLLLPKSERPLPAVVFVHGAGPQTREQYRKQGEYFASQGIAALIYDKRGTGESGGVYESRKPYENLVNDALAGRRAPETAPRDRTIADWHVGAQSRGLHQRRCCIPVERHSIHRCRGVCGG